MKFFRRNIYLALLLLHPTYIQSQQNRCDPCAGGAATYASKPGTACAEYFQCSNGEISDELKCPGETVFDAEKQYCNWPNSVTCVETTCPPTKVPSTGAPTVSVGDCPNPCPLGFDGSRTRPGSRCKEYVSCEGGEVVEEKSCFGDTLWNQDAGYCDWPISYSCEPLECPEREPTDTPTFMPTKAPVATISVTSPEVPVITVGGPQTPTQVVIVESADCPNPCPVGFTGFKTRPGSQCKRYVSCVNGGVAQELDCPGTQVFNSKAQYCDWPSPASCSASPCPKRQTPSPTKSPAASINIFLPGTPSVVTVPVGVSGPDTSPGTEISTGTGEVGTGTESSTKPTGDCPNPCHDVYSGLQLKPKTDCKIYVQCEDGEVIGEFECYGDNYFMQESGSCESRSSVINLREDWICPQVSCPSAAPTEMPTLSFKPSYLEEGDTTVVFVQEDTTPPTRAPVVKTPPPTQPPTPDPTPRPTRAPKTPRPTTARPTPMPSSAYQYFSSYLLEREDSLNEIVFQSNGSPSTAYTFPDFINSLNIAVFQLPADKAFFVGEGTDGRLPKLSGAEYGLVNIAAFLSNAMEEGIRIDSCDEWNTDARDDRFPLSNACGQYGRSYEDEECQGNEPFHCAVNKEMEITAVNGNIDEDIPPFTCRAKSYSAGVEIFPGYYDSFDDMVVETPFANTLGRTNIEGCCWWGKGVLLTRGRCTVGKLDKYLGQGAVEREVYVYPSIDFCTNPEAICNHPMTNQLRWVVGLLEWSDRVQSYTYDEFGDEWNYMDELKRFVDGGMANDAFINGVVNIITRNCHDEDSCEGRWDLDEETNLFEAIRKVNFRRIIFEVFNLPMTYQPTESPINPPTFSPTITPTVSKQPNTQQPVTQRPTVEVIPTNKPTRRKKGKGETIAALPPNSAQHWRALDQLTLIILLPTPILFLWI